MEFHPKSDSITYGLTYQTNQPLGHAREEGGEKAKDPTPCYVLFSLWPAKTCPDPVHSLSSPGAAASGP